MKPRITYWRLHRWIGGRLAACLAPTGDYRDTRYYADPRGEHAYIGSVGLDMPLHQRINHRAALLEFVGPDGRRTADKWAIYPGLPQTPQRTARSRYRHARRLRRQGKAVTACDIFFGLYPRGRSFDYSAFEIRKLSYRYHLAACLRGPLPPFTLFDDTETLRQQAMAARRQAA